MTNNAQLQQLVVFDTNVIEGRCLSKMLNGRTSDEIELVRSKGYTPTVHAKSFFEICHHAKLGTSIFQKQKPDGYPGGIEKGKQIMRRLPGWEVEHNVFWWFGLCEEWRGLDWEAERERVRLLASDISRESTLHEQDVRREFSEWKFSLSRFCDRVWNVLERETMILTDQDVYGDRADRLDRVFALQQEIALRSMAPSEDLELVVAALTVGASAFVTCDRRLSMFGGLSLSGNHETAFVHPDKLQDALEIDFRCRWSEDQTSERKDKPRR